MTTTCCSASGRPRSSVPGRHRSSSIAVVVGVAAGRSTSGPGQGQVLERVHLDRPLRRRARPAPPASCRPRCACHATLSTTSRPSRSMPGATHEQLPPGSNGSSRFSPQRAVNSSTRSGSAASHCRPRRPARVGRGLQVFGHPHLGAHVSWWMWARWPSRSKIMMSSAGLVDGREGVRRHGGELGGLSRFDGDLAVTERQAHPSLDDEEPIVTGVDPRLGRPVGRFESHLDRDRAAGRSAQHPGGALARAVRRRVDDHILVAAHVEECVEVDLEGRRPAAAGRRG